MQGKVVAVLLVVLVGWAYKAMQPSPPRICGSPNGPPIASPRIELRDGRHLAYKEAGTPRNKANYKIIFIHGFDSTKDNIPVASQELMYELGVYSLSYDRSGYGESDPNPKKTVKSEAMDVQELADKMELGPKFYVIGGSLGAYVAWSCLNYIPQRLAGVALVVPMVNYWWSFPTNLSSKIYRSMLVQDQISFWIAHHAPSLFYWWMTQKWFPRLAAVEGHPSLLSEEDKVIVEKRTSYQNSIGYRNIARQQGDFESIYRDLLAAFGVWEFDPMKLRNPFAEGEGSVHIWQGREDRYCPVELQRYVAEKLPWIKYHEHPTGGHAFTEVDGWTDAILKALLLGEPTAI